MAYKVVDNVFIVVHSREAPSNEEWDEYLEYYVAHLDKCQRILVISDGGGPNAVQRKKTSEAIKNTKTMTAVCTDQMLVRGIVTALAWFNNKIEAFPKKNVAEALKFLGASEAAASRLMAEATRLRSSIPD